MVRTLKCEQHTAPLNVRYVVHASACRIIKKVPAQPNGITSYRSLCDKLFLIDCDKNNMIRLILKIKGIY